MGDAEHVLVDRRDGIVTITLNRPDKKNAATMAMWAALGAALTEVARSPEDRVVVITGAGGAFCSGADVTGFGGDMHPLDRLRRVGETALALHRLPQPTIAKVEGVAVGAGCNLALGCDLIVASETARFSEIFARRGLAVDFGGSWLLPRLVGLHKAKELVLFGDILSAREAAEIGLVNRVVAPEDLDAVVDDWAHRLAAGPPLALSMSKAMLNHGLSRSMDEALEDEARSQAVALRSSDFTEAIAAFTEKREPIFRGR